MKTKKEWEARAHELSVKPNLTPYAHIMSWMSTEFALQLGREMADARAEEIAQRFEGVGMARHANYSASLAADIARSTITEPSAMTASEIVASDQDGERLKDIEALERADDVLRREHFISPEIIMVLGRLREPMTREQVLEEALREIRAWYGTGTQAEALARRALEWKP